MVLYPSSVKLPTFQMKFPAQPSPGAVTPCNATSMPVVPTNARSCAAV